MKKNIQRAVIFLLVTMLLMPVTAIQISAENSTFLPVSVVNGHPRPNSVTVFNSNYAKDTTSVSADIDALEIVVESNTIISMEGTDNKIPSDGFVAVIRGNDIKAKITEYNTKVGDHVYFDSDEKGLYILNETFNPSYTAVINYDKVNAVRSENTIVIYNTGTSSGTNIWGSEVVVDADGYVLSAGGNDNAIPTGGFVISAVGKARIAELENAAKVGMTVKVDTTTKTITFEYGVESYINSMKASMKDYQAALEQAESVYANIDYTKAKELETQLDALISDAKEALAQKNYALVMLNKKAFEQLYQNNKFVLVENPAVEQRAVWLRPTNSQNRDKVNTIVRDIYEMGYNMVFIELMYDSTVIFPVDSSEYLFSQNPSLKGFDVLAAYIEECHKYGMEIHAWTSVYRVGYEGSTYESLSVAALHKEWRCIAKSGIDHVYNMYGNGYFLNPALPEVKEALLKFYKYILETYDIDGFQLDYVRYPYTEGEHYGYDEYTMGLFKDKYGVDPMTLSSSSALWLDWCKFRAAFVTELVRSVSELIDTVRPDIYLTADVGPDFRDVYRKYLQEAEIWLNEDIIDNCHPMAYGTNVIPLYSSFTVEAAGDHAYACIGVGDYGTDVLERQIIECREAGSDGFAFFSYSQYVAGKYKDIVANGILANRALSSSYNSTVALSAQLELVKKRIENVQALSPTSLSADAAATVLAKLDTICDKLSAGEYAETVYNDIAYLISDIAASDASKSAKDVLALDLQKALKISKLSKDTYKNAYYKTHPLPDMYELGGDASDDESTEPSTEESTNSGIISNAQSDSPDTSATLSDTDAEKGGYTVLIVALSVAGVLIVALAVFFIIKRKK